jgi:hypothetical protein
MDIPDIFCITSVINTGNQPRSYTGIRSGYSMEERYEQSLQTIRSIRQNMPKGTLICFAECSDIPSYMERTLSAECDIFFQFKDDEYVRKACLQSAYKGYGELAKTKKVFEYILQNGISFSRFFKISGRYFLNDSFSERNFSKTSFTFRIPFPNSSCHPTVLYSVSYSNRETFLEQMIELEKEIEHCKDWPGYENLMPPKMNPKQCTPCCGVSGYVGFDKTFYQDV